MTESYGEASIHRFLETQREFTPKLLNVSVAQWLVVSIEKIL
jgi:hypothetical protein